MAQVGTQRQGLTCADAAALLVRLLFGNLPSAPSASSPICRQRAAQLSHPTCRCSSHYTCGKVAQRTRPRTHTQSMHGFAQCAPPISSARLRSLPLKSKARHHHAPTTHLASSPLQPRPLCPQRVLELPACAKDSSWRQNPPLWNTSPSGIQRLTPYRHQTNTVTSESSELVLSPPLTSESAP